MSAFRTSLRLETQRLRAQPWELALVSWVPALAALLLLWTFSTGVPTRLPIGVLDQDHSSLSRQLVRLLDATPGLHVAERWADEAQMQRALVAGRVQAAVQLPRGLAREVKHGRAGQVLLLHNAQLGTHSSMIQRDVRAVVATASAGIELNARMRRGQSPAAARQALEPLRAAPVALFNTATNYEQFLASALVPALLHILAMTAGAWAVGRELRDRSLGRWLQACVGGAPGWAGTLAALAGKLLPAWVLLTAVGLLALTALTVGRGWHPAGSLGWTMLALAVFMALSVAMGAFAAALGRSLRLALSATAFLTAPAFAFGGIGFPLGAMSFGARAWAQALPYTHYARVQVQQLQMGAPLAVSLAAPLAMLLATAALLAASAALLGRAARAPQSWGRR
ncbi:ABC transporter permease [Xenophilus sp. Marseille-Q4582]|uniref:ABC transporter permease n=1 Tax=Xenophilus sp. Marseille-Q4582 TaxID=2866600 RepID=UPI001CE40A88|nr:ABC transporter permease [Xenophilus sp. Marseille-Q4582]